MPTHAPGKVVGKSNGVCTSGMDIKKPVDEQYRAVTRAAALGLVVNLALGSAKLVGGLVSGSVALLSDAVNSLGDVFTSIITLIALRVAQQPPDAEHPYGHLQGRGRSRARTSPCW